MIISNSDINILNTAQQSKQHSSKSLDQLDKEAVARTIDLAVNTGETRVVFQRPLTETIRFELESNGYVLSKFSNQVFEDYPIIISWR